MADLVLVFILLNPRPNASSALMLERYNPSFALGLELIIQQFLAISEHLLISTPLKRRFYPLGSKNVAKMTQKGNPLRLCPIVRDDFFGFEKMKIKLRLSIFERSRIECGVDWLMALANFGKTC